MDQGEAGKPRRQEPTRSRPEGPTTEVVAHKPRSTTGSLSSIPECEIDLERPEGPISTDYEGPSSLKVYHKTDWLDRITVERKTLKIIEDHYPAIKTHLPLRLLFQYLLFDSNTVNLASWWNGEGPPLPGEMLAWMVGRKKQYQSANHRAVDLLWWAKDELFGDDFIWCEPNWEAHGSHRNRYRRVHTLSVVEEVVEAIVQDTHSRASPEEDRVWFDSGNKYNAKSAGEYRKARRNAIGAMNEDALSEKDSPEIPSKIQKYLNSLPINGFNSMLDDHMDRAYAAVNEEFERGPQGQISRSELHARSVLNHIEDSPKPLYEVRSKTHRLYAPRSLQNLNSEIRKWLVQDWIALDLKSAHLAICAWLWEIDSLLEFLHGGGDIWGDLIPHMQEGLDVEIGKPTIKEALYALTYGATIFWTDYGKQPSKITDIFRRGADLTEPQAKEARSEFRRHRLINDLYQARKHKKKEVEESGKVVDRFGFELELSDSSSDEVVTPLTLLTNEVSAVEMQLLWPAFREVIDVKYRCEIMLYTFDGIYIRPESPNKEDRWIRKLKNAVDEKAEKLGIPTELELED